MPDKKTDTRSEIIKAARIEFLAHGFEGARTQQIADQIGVTKAMIHYYFNTKRELFEHVFMRSAERMFEGIAEELENDTPLFQKIEQLIELCFDKATRDADVLSFVLTESKRNPDWLLPILKEEVSLSTDVLQKQIQEAADEYTISPVDANQLLLNIFSLCYYPAVSVAVNGALMGQERALKLMIDRKGIVLDTVLNWLTA